MIASGWEKSHPDFFYIITKSGVQYPKNSLGIVLQVSPKNTDINLYQKI